MPTGIVWDERYLLHDTGFGHPERADRLRAVHQYLQKSKLIETLPLIKPRLATIDEIELIHSLDHIRRVEETTGQTLHLDGDTVASPRSYEAARLAVGGLLECIDQVMAGTIDNAFAFVRPPGHHAEVERAMGFCLFNNVAIAAEYARKRHDVARVFIIDFDVHHGNGTQWAFYERPDIFYCSIHRYPFYPGTGACDETGKGEGKETTLNLEMKGGEGDLEYDTTFEKEILQVARDFDPDLILVSAGYDAHRLDPLGGMNLTAEGYRQMMTRLCAVAGEVCAGRLVAVLEGGYDLTGLTEGVAASLAAMMGDKLSI